jgi:hypothetical protein
MSSNSEVTTFVRSLLVLLLADTSEPGAGALKAQAAHATAVGGEPPTKIRLSVPSDLPRSVTSNGTYRYVGLVGEVGEKSSGLLQLWIRDGALSEIEYSWFNEMPTELPSLDQVTVVDKTRFRRTRL